MTTQSHANSRDKNNNEKVLILFLILFFVLFSISFGSTVYRLITKPGYFQKNINVEIKNIEESNDSILMNIERVIEFPTFFKIQGWAILDGTPSNEIKPYIVFQSKERRIFFDIQSHRRPDVTIAFKNANYDNSGILCHCLKSSLVPGEYYIGVYIKKRNKEFIAISGARITIP